MDKRVLIAIWRSVCDDLEKGIGSAFASIIDNPEDLSDHDKTRISAMVDDFGGNAELYIGIPLKPIEWQQPSADSTEEDRHRIRKTNWKLALDAFAILRTLYARVAHMPSKLGEGSALCDVIRTLGSSLEERIPTAFVVLFWPDIIIPETNLVAISALVETYRKDVDVTLDVALIPPNWKQKSKESDRMNSVHVRALITYAVLRAYHIKKEIGLIRMTTEQPRQDELLPAPKARKVDED